MSKTIIDHAQMAHECLHYKGTFQINTNLTTVDAVRWLKSKADYTVNNAFYLELCNAIVELRQIQVPVLFIERFALDKLGQYILSTFDLHVGEVFALALVILHSNLIKTTLNYKLVNSGLLMPFISEDNKSVFDTEIIADMIVKGLLEKKLLTITPHGQIIPGLELKLKLA